MASESFTGLTVYASSGNFIITSPSTISLDDSGAGDPSVFEFGEAINGPANLFQGTVSIDGVDYPVTDNGTTFGVYGIELSSIDYPTIASLGPIDTSDFTPCFLTDTQIATPDGTQRVQDLQIGDQITLLAGGSAAVKWIGHKVISTRFAPAERLMPVRFAAGSLGPNVPHSDLTVTADHAMLIDGVLCNASALVNGTTIIRVPLADMGETFTVYHIETEAHEIILANGTPTETFIDNVSRRVFDNFAEYQALYGDEAEMTELPYPRAMSARQVPAFIAERVAA